MGTSSLPLSQVVDVTVLISPQAPATPTFNQGLIVGTSNVIGSVTGANPRVRRYTTLTAILADGFTLVSPEYLAASLYFGQVPAPQYIWIGRQDLTAISAATVDAGGTGYVVGDIVTVVQSGASLGQLQVLTVTGGVVDTVQPVQGSQGTLYSVATDLPTTGGTGTGLTVNITVIGETALQAMEACRLASTQWWAACSLAAVDADHIAIGEWAQGITPQLMYFYTTGTAPSLNGTTGNVFSVLKAGSFSRAFGIYSTVQQGLAPNNIYSQAAAMGVAMGLNTGLANSYFTMKFKQLIGIIAEPLNLTQIGVIEGNNGNLYLDFANGDYNWIEQGVVASGQFFDEILNLDMLASNIQFNCVDLLTSVPSIPQTNAGQSQILNAVNQACAQSALIGFIAPGTWEGVTILNLSAGTSLPNGYTSQSASYLTQATADKVARKSMPVYVAIIEAGAVHSILIGVYVQQ